LPGRVQAELRSSLRAHSALIALVVLYVAAAHVVARLTGLRRDSYLEVLGDGFLLMAGLYVAGLLVAYALYTLVVIRPRRPLAHIQHGLTEFLSLERLCTALPALLLLPAAVSSFGTIKGAIPLLHPYDWDPVLSRFTADLYGGRRLWEWLQPLLGHPWITIALNAVYNSWFFVLWSVLFWQATSIARPVLRMRFFLSSVLAWALLGNLLATVMASAGPAFYGRLTGLPDPYAPLMAYLHKVDAIAPVWALQAQELLWRCQAHGNPFIGCGISAMPSMHAATSFLFVLLGFGVSRGLGLLFSLFLALILVGSVHLGWHYSLDDYVALAGTWAIWGLVGRALACPLLRRWLWGPDAASAAPAGAAARCHVK